MIQWARKDGGWRCECLSCGELGRATADEQQDLERDAGTEPVITGVIELPIELVEAAREALQALSLSEATQHLRGAVHASRLADKLSARLLEHGG